jgi:hypothetical protein
MLIYSESFNRLLKGLLALVLSMLLTEGYAGPKYWPAQKGQVQDTVTGEPMAGVFVIARYWGYYPVPDSSSACYHAAGTTTNEQGEYSIPSHFDLMDIKVDKRSKLKFFKPGYRHVFYKDGIAKLEKEQGGREERLEELTRIARISNCHAAGRSQQMLFPYYESIYYEAKAISVTEPEKKHLEWFRSTAASKAIASNREKNMDGTEHENLIKDYLKDHLQ